MTISKDLMLAILSLDSYNRGYHSGINDTGEGDNDGLGDDIGTKIGVVSVKNKTNSSPNSTEVNAGFYAISYKIDDGSKIDGLNTNDTIIAYRGNDDYGEGVYQRLIGFKHSIQHSRYQSYNSPSSFSCLTRGSRKPAKSYKLAVYSKREARLYWIFGSSPKMTSKKS